MEELQASVFVEKLLQKGYEVIFLTEAVDEYMMTHLTEFDDKKFQDASKDDLKLDKDDKKGLKKLKVRRPAKLAPAQQGRMRLHTRVACVSKAQTHQALLERACY